MSNLHSADNKHLLVTRLFCRAFTPQGTVPVPPSKSIAQRALILASIADSPSFLKNIGTSADVRACIQVLSSLGAQCSPASALSYADQIFPDNQAAVQEIIVTPLPIEQFATATTVNCGESATLARMLAAIIPALRAKHARYTHKEHTPTVQNNHGTSCKADVPFTISGTGTLLTRPMAKTARFLRTLGVEVTLKNAMTLPMEIAGCLTPGTFFCDEVDSSQPVSGALIGLSLLDSDSVLKSNDLPSLPYALLTAEIANKFGAQITLSKSEAEDSLTWHIKGVSSFTGARCMIEGDWSSAALLFAAAALSGSITVTGLTNNSIQPDSIILEILKNYGADCSVNSIVANRDASSKDFGMPASMSAITVSAHKRRAFCVDIRNTPDIFPAVCLLAAGATETSTIYGIEYLRCKESDRVTVMLNILNAIGAKALRTRVSLEITGTTHFTGTQFTLPADHRMIMVALLLASNLAPHETIGIAVDTTADIESIIAKSYPDFLSAYTHIGGFLS